LSDDFELYVRTTDKGLCTIHRVADNAEIARLPDLGERAEAGFGAGRLLAVRGSSGRFQLWDLSSAEPVHRLQEGGIYGWYFRSDGRLLALSHSDGSISVYDLAAGQRAYHLAPNGIVKNLDLALHPSEPFVACFSYLYHPVFIRDLRTGALAASANPPWRGGNGGCAWSPDGRTLTVLCGDSGAIQPYTFEPTAPALQSLRTMVPIGGRFFDTLAPPALRPLPPIQGPDNGGPWLFYNPAGDRFVSRGWDSVVHLFDAVSGQWLFSTHALPTRGILRFDRSGRRLAAARVGDRQERVGLWSVADAREYRALVHSGRAATWGNPAIHPGGRLAAIGLEDGVALFDLETGSELAHLPLSNRAVPHKSHGTAVNFDGTGSLLTNGLEGFFRWPIRPDPAKPGRLLVGLPKSSPFFPGDKHVACSRDGRVIAQCMWNGYDMQNYAGGWILHPNSPKPQRVRVGLSTSECSVTPDGRWVAFSFASIHVFEAATGKRVWQLPAREAGHCRFSPDGRWLATDADGGRLYAVGTWEPGPRLGPGIPWDISPDSTLVILGQTNGIYCLVELATSRELARLEDPEQNTRSAVFSPDGAKLVVAAKNGLRVWDLRRIRTELAKLELDWRVPPLPAASGGANASSPAPTPLTLHFEVGDVRHWAQATELDRQAHLYLRKKEHAKALAALRQAMKFAPSRAMAQNNLAWLLLTGPQELRDPAQALLAARKAVELDSNKSCCLNTLGVALYRTGQYADAIPVLERSLREQRGQADAFDLFFLAMCHHRLGDADKAKKCYGRACRWLQEHKSKLAPGWREELTAFQDEAETVLSQTPGNAKK
jgi:WD40 repeat protein/Tfp pilus assembly protein PilF